MSENRFFLSARQISVLVLALAIVLLALFNNTPVAVSLLVTVVSVPLSVLVLGALLVGVFMGNAMALQRRKRRTARTSGRAARKQAKAEAQMLAAAEPAMTDEVALGGAEAEYAELEDQEEQPLP